MRRRRLRPSAILAWGTILGLAVMGMFSVAVSAAVPGTVDAYGSEAFSAAVHSSAGTNAFPNFAGGAVDNRYPLVTATQNISPATDARGSVNDYGPLGATVITMDCNAPPPPPLPNPNPGAPPNYCLSGVRDAAPYAHSQYPHPPGSGDEELNKNGGHVKVHSEELKTDATGEYNGSGNEATAPVVQNATAQVSSVVGADGVLTVKTHSHIGSANFGAGFLVVTNTDVQVEIRVAGGKPVITTTVAPGTVTAGGQPVQVSDQAVTIGTTSIPVGGIGNAGGAAFTINTLAPQKTVEGNRGKAYATGLSVTVTQPGIPASGVPSQTVGYTLGEGLADAFASPATPFTSTFGSNGAPVAGAINDTFGGGSGSGAGYTGGAPSSLPNRASRAGGAGSSASGALLPIGSLPFALLFFLWELIVFAAAATTIYNRRRALAEESA
jgi:hypothetical protein